MTNNIEPTKETAEAQAIEQESSSKTEANSLPEPPVAPNAPEASDDESKENKNHVKETVEKLPKYAQRLLFANALLVINPVAFAIMTALFLLYKLNNRQKAAKGSKSKDVRFREFKKDFKKYKKEVKRYKKAVKKEKKNLQQNGNGEKKKTPILAMDSKKSKKLDAFKLRGLMTALNESKRPVLEQMISKAKSKKSKSKSKKSKSTLRFKI